MNLYTAIREISRILRPQGLFLACEWIPGIFTRNGTNVSRVTSPATEILDQLLNLSSRLRLFCDPLLIPRVLGESASFENVATERHLVHLDNTAIGQRAKRSVLDFTEASRYCLLDAGLDLTEVDRYATALRSDLENGVGLCLIYMSVHGRRKEAP